MGVGTITVVAVAGTGVGVVVRAGGVGEAGTGVSVEVRVTVADGKGGEVSRVLKEPSVVEHDKSAISKAGISRTKGVTLVILISLNLEKSIY